MLVQLWPYINDMVVKILKEQVEPEIQKNVPGFLSSIHFEEISLGQVVSLNAKLSRWDSWPDKTFFSPAVGTGE